MTRQQPRPSAYAWLWAELERRFGADVAQEIKAGYLAQQQAYQRAVWETPSPWQPRAKPPPKRKKEQ